MKTFLVCLCNKHAKTIDRYWHTHLTSHHRRVLTQTPRNISQKHARLTIWSFPPIISISFIIARYFHKQSVPTAAPLCPAQCRGSQRSCWPMNFSHNNIVMKINQSPGLGQWRNYPPLITYRWHWPPLIAQVPWLTNQSFCNQTNQANRSCA